MNRYYNYHNTRKPSLKESLLLGAGVMGFAILAPYAGAKITESGFDSDDARRVAENSGYTDPEIIEVNRFFPGFQGCDKGDLLGFEMIAVAQNGAEVDLTICKGLFKAATLRQD
jgi:hypothetical protein